MGVITISRQSGSEGNLITQILCERLGYRYFDKRLMAQLGEEMGMKANQIMDASSDQYRARGILERMFGNIQTPFGDPGGWATGATLEAQQALNVQQVRRLIYGAYEHGNVVIVGRGGQVVLSELPDVLHVRIVAPIEIRIQRWRARAGLSYEAARERVRDRDKAHIDFIRHFYNLDVNNPDLYDLILSTEKITPSAAAEVIIKALDSVRVLA